MTKKDYIAISAAIKDAIDSTCSKANGMNEREFKILSCAQILLVNRISEVMAQDNPKFDGTKFAKACGL